MLAELDVVPRMSLAVAPTPLQETPRLAAAIGLDRLLVKRDDLTGLAMGGNKARKLEYLLADAVGKGADVLITTGAAQSNHCRLTAAAARVAGIDAHLVFREQPVDEIQGNMLLDQLLGATWSFAGDRTPDECMKEVAAKLAAEGRRPYIIPAGGSNGRGALGYVRCGFELTDELRSRGEKPRYVMCAGGSCGTLSGLTLGLALAGGPPLAAVSISRSVPDRVAKARQIMAESCAIMEVENPNGTPVIIDGYVGPGYGMTTELSKRALEAAARTEGLILDPVYTAKAFGGLIGEIEAGRIKRDDVIVFVHTGGMPALFADPKLYWHADNRGD